jgi:hypothetical protein
VELTIESAAQKNERGGGAQTDPRRKITAEIIDSELKQPAKQTDPVSPQQTTTADLTSLGDTRNVTDEVPMLTAQLIESKGKQTGIDEERADRIKLWEQKEEESFEGNRKQRESLRESRGSGFATGASPSSENQSSFSNSLQHGRFLEKANEQHLHGKLNRTKSVGGPQPPVPISIEEMKEEQEIIKRVALHQEMEKACDKSHSQSARRQTRGEQEGGELAAAPKQDLGDKRTMGQENQTHEEKPKREGEGDQPEIQLQDPEQHLGQTETQLGDSNHNSEADGAAAEAKSSAAEANAAANAAAEEARAHEADAKAKAELAEVKLAAEEARCKEEEDEEETALAKIAKKATKKRQTVVRVAAELLVSVRERE